MAQGIYVSPQARVWLGGKSSSLAANYLLMDKQAQSRIIPVAGRRVGLVFFAPADPAKASEIAAAERNAIEAGRQIGREVDLLIGISPWGDKTERAFAARAEGLYHIILGGGPGYGFAASVGGSGSGVLRARPESRGRSVNVIEVLQWPEPAMHAWQYQVNFTARTQLLDSSIPSDPVIMEIFSYTK